MVARSALNTYEPAIGVELGSAACHGPKLPTTAMSPCGVGLVRSASKDDGWLNRKFSKRILRRSKIRGRLPSCFDMIVSRLSSVTSSLMNASGSPSPADAIDGAPEGGGPGM